MPPEMTDDEAAQVMMQGLELLGNCCRMIAMLPLEDWDRMLDRAEDAAAITDPTLLRNYMQSTQARLVRDLIRKAIPLKQAVIGWQPEIRAVVERDAKGSTANDE